MSRVLYRDDAHPYGARKDLWTFPSDGWYGYRTWLLIKRNVLGLKEALERIDAEDLDDD